MVDLFEDLASANGVLLHRLHLLPEAEVRATIGGLLDALQAAGAKPEKLRMGLFKSPYQSYLAGYHEQGALSTRSAGRLPLIPR